MKIKLSSSNDRRAVDHAARLIIDSAKHAGSYVYGPLLLPGGSVVLNVNGGDVASLQQVHLPQRVTLQVCQ